MRVVVITGMSGSGKTNALRALEDLGYYAIDNLPIPLLAQLVELVSKAGDPLQQIALVVDARVAALVPGEDYALAMLPPELERLKKDGHDVDLVFLDANDEALARRFLETRRRHPLSTDGSVEAGIDEERRLLNPLSQAATAMVDTTELSVHDLKRTMQQAFSTEGTSAGLSVTVSSFGYKYGVPPDANLMFDVRFLPNPFFVPDLKALSGHDDSVASYVLGQEEATAFIEQTKRMLDFLLPRYEAEGKAYLTVAIGCTGGRHRSVAIAKTIAEHIRASGRRVLERHRDVDR